MSALPMLEITLDGLSSQRAPQRRKIFGCAHPLQSLARIRQSVSYSKPLRFVDVAGLFQETLQVLHVTAPQAAIDALLGLEPCRIPVARQQGLPCKQTAHLRIAKTLS